MIFHTFFSISFFIFILIRVFYHRKAKRLREGVKYEEGKLNTTVRAVMGLGYIGLLVVYAFYPLIFQWAEISLPLWVRWLGTGVALSSVLLIWWVQWALDVQFHTTLHTQVDHQLIKHGPYRWVRHPMYSALFTMGIGWLLTTANLLIGGPLAAAILIIMSVRVKNEEVVLIDLFGDEYRNYMKRTGRFLPKLTTH